MKISTFVSCHLYNLCLLYGLRIISNSVYAICPIAVSVRHWVSFCLIPCVHIKTMRLSNILRTFAFRLLLNKRNIGIQKSAKVNKKYDIGYEINLDDTKLLINAG